MILLPDLQRFAQKLLGGIHSLILDAREITSPYSGVVDMPDGTKSFWGLSKKAVGQSLPWLGLMLLFARPSALQHRSRALISAAVLVLVFAFPFLVRGWHGGMSSNMRYFLPVMPVVAILAAVALRDLLNRSPSLARSLLWAVPFGFVLSFAWATFLPTGLAGAHQMLALYVFLATALVCLVAAFVSRIPVAHATLLVAGAAIGVSVFNTMTDTAVSQFRRENRTVLTDVTQGFDGRILIYDKLLRSALLDPDQIVAVPQTFSDGPDSDLVAAAIEAGYRVLMPDIWAEEFTQTYPGYEWFDVEGPVDVAEVIRAPEGVRE